MRSIVTGCLLLCCASIQAAELGRLFFTPEERARMSLEQARNSHPADNPNMLSVDGIVQRKGGRRTVWINGTPREENGQDRVPDSATVSVPGQPAPVRIKVGEKVLVSPKTERDSQAEHE